MPPENVVEALSPPVVRLAAPPLLVTVPEPASAPIDWLNPPRSSVAPGLTVWGRGGGGGGEGGGRGLRGGVAPAPWEMPRKNVGGVVGPPVVGVAAPRLLVTVPERAGEPIDWLNPPRSSVAPVLTVWVLLAE